MPDYDYYGYYGHVKSSSPYESLLYDEYAKWNYSSRVSKAIKAEVEQCREKAAIFDLSSFGKVNRFYGSLNAINVNTLCHCHPISSKIRFAENLSSLALKS